MNICQTDNDADLLFRRMSGKDLIVDYEGATDRQHQFRLTTRDAILDDIRLEKKTQADLDAHDVYLAEQKKIREEEELRQKEQEEAEEQALQSESEEIMDAKIILIKLKARRNSRHEQDHV